MDSGSDHLPEIANETLRTLMADAPADPLPTHLGHWDFRSANILCAGAEVAAVIDFEQLRIDHQIVELARSAIMLGTRFRNWGPVPIEVHAQLLAGYQSVRRLTCAEAKWWDVLLLWQALIAVPTTDDPTGWLPAALRHVDQLATRET